MKFKDLRESLTEATQGKKYKVGKYKAEIKKEGSKFAAYLDGEKLDKFNSMNDAQKGIKDFIDLLDEK